MSDSLRYIGLELAGAKNQKTSIAALEFYPKEKKIFLLDIFDRIAVHEDQSSDEALLEVLEELKPGIARMGVNVPLELPPCLTCTRKKCPLPQNCTVPAVKWMREITRKAHKNDELEVRVRDFTPYTQRPIELWARYHVLPKLPEHLRFDIDETLGGNKAPLTARMSFLMKHLSEIPMIEVWPKLSIAILTEQLGLDKRLIASYRQLEDGAHAREEILEALTDAHGIFIYERDVRKLAHNLGSFDAFVCAYTALLSDTDLCSQVPHGFPLASGWVDYPVC